LPPRTIDNDNGALRGRRQPTGDSRSDLKPHQRALLPAVLSVCGICALATSPPPGRVLGQLMPPSKGEWMRPNSWGISQPQIVVPLRT
jgi:hypothetical protein